MSKSFDSLIPSIEQREAGWQRIQERLSRDPAGVAHPTVTISREYGCEGYPLAECLQRLLEAATAEPWTIFDKALVEKVAAEENLSLSLLNRLGDEGHAVDVLRNHFGFLTHDEAYAQVVKHLVQVATAGSAIIVGRGGALACQGLKNCFHFRLVGSFAFRAATIGRRLDLPRAEAEELVRSQSRLREKFISDSLRADITAPLYYDAVFNNERLPPEAIARACFQIIAGGWPDQGYFKRHG